MLVYGVLGFALLLTVIFAIKAIITLRGLTQEAQSDYAYRSAKGLETYGADEADYIRGYRRFHGPRGSLFAAATLLGLTALTMPWLKVLEVLYEYAWRWGGQDRAYEPGYLVWQFMLFGGLIIGWALMVYFGARTYHRGAPKSLAAEIKKEIEKGH